MLTQMLLTNLLTAGAATATTQRIAAATIATAKDATAETIGEALLSCEHVTPDVLSQMLVHPHPAVRAKAWGRPEVTSEQAREAVATEAAPSVIHALVGKLDIGDLVEVTRMRNSGKRRCAALYQAALEQRLLDLPVDLITEALGRISSPGVPLVTPLAASGLDLSAVATNPRIPACFRFAACVSTGTPLAVVNAHLADIVSHRSLAAASTWSAYQRLLDTLSERVPEARLLWDAYRAQRSGPGKAARQAAPVDREELARLALLRRELAAADSPTLVAQVWSRAADLQPELATLALEHRYCPYEVFLEALPKSDASTFAVAAKHQPLWSRQDQDVFTTLIRQNPYAVRDQLVAIGNSTVDEPVATLLEWMLDALLASEDATSGMASYVWADLLAHPAFPRHRLGEIPAERVNEALATQDPNLLWVAETVDGWLSHLGDVDPSVAATILTASVTTDGPLGEVFTAVTHATR